MLSTIREKTQGIIATFILALIGIPFALWGINSYFDSGSQIKIATVDGTDITQDSFRDEMERIRRRVADPKMLETPQFKQTLLNNMIDQTLIIRDAEEQGFRIGNTQLADIIRQQPDFQREGKFDPSLYETWLRREGLTPQQFETRVREEILLTHLQAGFGESRFITRVDINTIARLLTQEREIAYAVIGTESLLGKIAVSPQDIEKYYADHPAMFQIPEAVRIEYLRLSASDRRQGYQPTEEELSRAYAEEAARYVTPEKRRASHILISLPAQPAEEKAKEALAKIQDIARQARSGSDFAVLARKHSMDPATASQGGDLGELRRGMLPKELDVAVYALKPGEVSQPVRSAYGYHVVKLTQFTPEKRKPLVEVRKELTDILNRKRGEEAFLDKSEKLRNLVYEQPDSLVPAAKALGLEIQKSDWFTQAGGAGIAAHPKVVQATFEPEVLSQARNSDAIDISADTLVAVRVTEHRPAGRKPLSQVRAEVERQVRLERALTQARESAEAILREAREQGTLKTVATRHGLSYYSPKTVTRQKTEGLDPRIVELAFRSARPAGDKPVHELVALDSKGYAILAVHRVREVEPKNVAEMEKTITRLLEARRGSDYFTHYRAGLRQNAEVRIYPDQL